MDERKTAIIKKIMTWFGRILVVLSLFFIVRSLSGLDIKWESLKRPYLVIFKLLGLSFLIVLCNSMFAYVWKTYLDLLTGKKLPAIDIIYIYLKSNIAKYLPGNVLQYVSRNVLGDKLHIGHKNILMATVMEVTTLFIETIVFSAAISWKSTCNVFEKLLNSYKVDQYILPGIVVVVAIAGMAVIYFVKKGWFHSIKKYVTVRSVGIIVRAFIIYGVIRLISAFILYYIFKVILGIDFSYSAVASADALSWLAGYVVPGAPGGIGIREVVLMWLLEAKCQKENIILVAVLLRLCAITGDFLTFLTGCLVMRLSKRGMKSEKYS